MRELDQREAWRASRPVHRLPPQEERPAPEPAGRERVRRALSERSRESGGTGTEGG
jgi:hypothetical protein